MLQQKKKVKESLKKLMKVLNLLKLQKNTHPVHPKRWAGIWEHLKKDQAGLVAAIIREQQTGTILMQAYLDQEAFIQTLATGLMHYHSRSRGRLWLKGESSDHFQQVRAIAVDCDADCLLVDVLQLGPACHTGSHSCFFRSIEDLSE